MERPVKTRLAELAAKFVDRSRGDIKTMREALAKFEAGQGDALDELQHLAHRMVGTGATLGFNELADRAQTIEQLAEAQAPGAPSAPGLCRGFREAIDDLEAELRRRQG